MNGEIVGDHLLAKRNQLIKTKHERLLEISNLVLSSRAHEVNRAAKKTSSIVLYKIK